MVFYGNSFFLSSNGEPLEMTAATNSVQDQKYGDSRKLSDDRRVLIIRADFPQQKMNGEADRVLQTSFESLETSQRVIVISNFALNIALSASLNHIWSMINT